MKKIASYADGNGGGSPTFAQGGTSYYDDYNELLSYIMKEFNNND